MPIDVQVVATRIRPLAVESHKLLGRQILKPVEPTVRTERITYDEMPLDRESILALARRVIGNLGFPYDPTEASEHWIEHYGYVRYRRSWLVWDTREQCTVELTAELFGEPSMYRPRPFKERQVGHVADTRRTIERRLKHTLFPVGKSGDLACSCGESLPLRKSRLNTDDLHLRLLDQVRPVTSTLIPA